MNDRIRRHIVIQLQLMLELTELLQVPASEVCARADAFLSAVPEEDETWGWPEDNRLGQQTQYLEKLLAEILRKLGITIPGGRRDAIPSKSQDVGWDGGAPEEGKVPGVNT